MSDSTVVVGVLAAGASRRLGTPKQLVMIDGVPLLRRQLLRALAASIGQVAVILGAHSDACRESIADLPADIRVNQRWAEGMASSLCEATVVARAYGAGGLMVLPCDLYRLSEGDLSELHRVWSQDPDVGCLSRFGQGLGPPAIVPSRLFPQLENLAGDVGARSILTSPGENCREVDMPHAAFDLDRPSDLEVIGGCSAPNASIWR